MKIRKACADDAVVAWKIRNAAILNQRGNVRCRMLLSIFLRSASFTAIDALRTSAHPTLAAGEFDLVAAIAGEVQAVVKLLIKAR